MDLKSNLFIGALGGSGTRVIAQIVNQLGYYIGDDLNKPNDNLVFTRLFKNPEWYKTTDQKEIYSRLEIFDEYMTSQKLSLYHLLKYFTIINKNKLGREPIVFINYR